MKTGLLACVGLCTVSWSHAFQWTASPAIRSCEGRQLKLENGQAEAGSRDRRCDTRLYSIRTGKSRPDDEGPEYDDKYIVDPDVALTPEQWLDKYGEEVDTSVLYDEKVRRSLRSDLSGTSSGMINRASSFRMPISLIH